MSRISDFWARYGEKIEPYIFISPFYITFLLFFLWPLSFSFFMSFTDWRGVSPGNYVGFKNYISIFNDSAFQKALLNNIWYAIVIVIILLPTGLILSNILNSKKTKGRKVFRTIFITPIATSAIIVGIVFLLIYDSRTGILNWFLTNIGLPRINWLGNPAVTKPSVSILFMWRNLGLVMLYFLAGLQGIDEQIYDAAVVDGANSVQTFLYVTIPMLKPIILFVGIIMTQTIFKIFQEPHILYNFTMGPSGGPRDAGLSLAQLLYRVSFEYQMMGKGSAIGVILFLIITIVAMIQLFSFGTFKAD